jgi:hypothetical protein
MARTGDRAALTDRIARLEGALSVLAPPREAPDGVGGVDRVVLDAAVDVLEAEMTQAGEELFADLNNQVVALARDFGMRDLNRVELDRAGRLQVFKTGGPREWFTHQSPGERLRLRIALVVALLRVGTARGIATHPGLLLIDSPKAEEVQDHDAAALLTALERLCAGTPGLQVMLTSVDERLVRRVLTNARIIAPLAAGQPLW